MRNIHIVMAADWETSWPAGAYTSRKEAQRRRDKFTKEYATKKYAKSVNLHYWVESLKVNETDDGE